MNSIHDICEKYNIENYTINPDGTIDVNGNIQIASELKAKLNKIMAERLVFFIDSCFAQGMTKGSDLKNTSDKLEALEKELEQQNAKHSETPEGLVHDLDDEEGMAIISACKDNQKSLYFKGDNNSLFTTYLLKVLRGEHKTRFDSKYNIFLRLKCREKAD